MTKQKLWDRWTRAILAYVGDEESSLPNDMKLQFFGDCRELIKKHQEPYKNAMDNIACELQNLTDMEVKDAEAIAKRLR